MRKYDYVLFDLDGTLTASAEGVRLSIVHAMSVLGLPCPDLSDYSLYIGPPLVDTFRGLCAVPEEKIPEVMQNYLEHYDIVGLVNNGVFDGVISMLDKLCEAGCKIAVCTSKNEPVAERVVDEFGLRKYFDAICGSMLDGARKEKSEVIPYTLDTLGCTDKSRAVMIGDTHFDARGASIAGVDFVGVTYGYGTHEGMEAYGAVGFAESPKELLHFLI